MKITIDENSGFCFGVVYAIQLAEDELDAGHTVYCLGDIVHNDLEVQRLKAKGLQIIEHKDLAHLEGEKVLIRAHGEPPSTYQTAIENNLELIDASCPVVLKLQNRVKNTFDGMLEGGQVVIYGKPGHAEVNGLRGQTNDSAIIIMSEADTDKIDFTKPIYLFSQTTKSTEGFYKMKQLLIDRAAAAGNAEVHAHDTICRQVSNRDPKLREFAPQHDVIIFVAGKKSSNGKVLYNVCKEVNPQTYFVSGPDELQDEWFEGAETVGICGATSTPRWLMEEVGNAISGVPVV